MNYWTLEGKDADVANKFGNFARSAVVFLARHASRPQGILRDFFGNSCSESHNSCQLNLNVQAGDNTLSTRSSLCILPRNVAVAQWRPFVQGAMPALIADR